MEDMMPATRVEVSEKYNNVFNSAYKEFLRLVLAAEENGLGVLRPGIIDVFRVIKAQRDAGLCKGVMIYSNNLLRCALEFIKDLLELAVGGAVICECVARNHPDRWDDNDDLYGDSTMPRKTWAVMTRILMNGACRAPSFSLRPADVVFFDDQIHPDLVEMLGPVGNYIQLVPHHTPANFDAIAKIYKDALLYSGLLADENSDVYTLFKQNVAICDPDFQKSDIEEHIAVYKGLTSKPNENVMSVDADAILAAVKRAGSGGSRSSRGSKGSRSSRGSKGSKCSKSNTWCLWGRKRRHFINKTLKGSGTQNGSGIQKGSGTQKGSRVQGPRKSRRNHKQVGKSMGP
jgi:hypothetical protein